MLKSIIVFISTLFVNRKTQQSYENQTLYNYVFNLAKDKKLSSFSLGREALDWLKKFDDKDYQKMMILHKARLMSYEEFGTELFLYIKHYGNKNVPDKKIVKRMKNNLQQVPTFI